MMSRNNRRNLPLAGSAARRNQQSCQQCRKDKQKCSPSTRDWQSKHERCERCVRLDHPCGPSSKSPKRLSNVHVSNTRMDVIARIMVESDNLKIVDNTVSKESGRPSPECLPEQSGLVALTHRGSMGHSRLEHSMEDRETIRMALARLADMNTAREMLLEARRYTNSVKLWFREMSIFMQTLGVLIEDIEIQFHREIASAIDNVGTGVEAESDIAATAILQSHQRFSYPHILGGNRTTFAESSHMQKILHLSRRTRKGAASDPVCGSTREIISGDDDKYNTVLAYMDASEAIAHVLELLDSNGRQLKAHKSQRFPGDQIAYMYGNNSAALQLWSLCQEKDSSVDVLGRNLLHVVVHNSDYKMLQRILSLQGTYATAIDATDMFGVTPLEIAVCQDDAECFSILTFHGARQDTAFNKHGDSLIALAQRNKSSKVLGLMLEAGVRLPSPSPEACEAFESEAHDGMSPITTELEEAVLSPRKILEGQNSLSEELRDSVTTQRDYHCYDSILASKLMRNDEDFSLSEHPAMLSFDNADTWAHWANFDVDMQFDVDYDFTEMILPLTIKEECQT